MNHAKIMVIADLNYWANDVHGGPHSAELTDLTNLNFTQHVSSATHIKGHILDQAWTMNLVVSAPIILPFIWSDHHLLKFTVTIPTNPKIPIAEGGMFRKWSALNKEEFIDTLANSLPSPDKDIDHMEGNISTWLLSVSNMHTPLKKSNSSSSI